MNAKRWLPLFLLLWALPLIVKAQFTFTTNIDGTLTLTRYSGPGDNVIIPSSVNGTLVTSVGPYAFVGGPYYIPVATNIYVPATITSLATNAFSGVGSYEDSLLGVFFAGNAPAGSNVCAYSYLYPPGNAIFYHLPGTTGFDTNFYVGSIQVYSPGQLQVTLSPTNATFDGAAWQVDGSVWQTSGGPIGNLSYGTHTVSFKTIPGWIAPPDQTVFVDTNFITTIAANSYVALPGGPSRGTFQVLHTFATSADPVAPLILVSNVLYGTTVGGGNSNQGTIFAINTDGTGFTSLYSFTNGGGCYAPLTPSGNVLYGTTVTTTFRINVDGTGFATLCTNLVGAYKGVVLVSNTLYGVMQNGGSSVNGGAIFAVNTDGSGFGFIRLLGTNVNDASYPQAGLVASGTTLYGGTFEGNSGSGAGYPFAIQTDGSGFTNFPYQSRYAGTFALSGNVLYGLNSGGIFKMKTDGTGLVNIFKTIYTQAGVTVAGNTLYGTQTTTNTRFPTDPGYYGTVFAVRTDGTGFTNFYDFPPGGPYNTAGTDGAYPYATVLLSGTTLYGTTSSGGTNGSGTIYMVSFPHPQLTIKPSGTNFIFSWPSGIVGAGYDTFLVQSSTNIYDPSGWTTIPTAPFLVNGLNTVTNPIPGTATLYRLSQ